MKNRKRTLSGIKPTGTPHLGNYLGMIKPALALQKTHETFYFIADYHALTTERDKNALQAYTLDLTATFLALGMDVDNHTFFLQSDVPQVTELAWLLGCVTPLGLLERAHAYKDARAKNQEINHGLFAYPVLMAADILAYDADEVPVGQDQQQHLDITRDIARRLNHLYGKGKPILIEPEARIEKTVATIPGIDGRKMSKSYGNQLPLFAEDKVLRKAVMQIVTDSRGMDEAKDPDQCNVFHIFRHFASAEQQASWAEKYRVGGMGYGEIKQALFETLVAELGTYRDEYMKLRAKPADLQAVLAEGGKKARSIACEVVERVRTEMGLSSKASM